jgi:hypothetical protein
VRAACSSIDGAKGPTVATKGTNVAAAFLDLLYAVLTRQR